MAYRKVLTWPDKKLSQVSKPVQDFEKIPQLLKDMEDTLKITNGSALAAPQINFRDRVIMIDCNKFDQSNPDDPVSSLDSTSLWVLINPVILKTKDKINWEEGCLSVQFQTAWIERAKEISISYKTWNGEKRKLELDFPLSAVVQHEMDHLDGKLFLDQLSSFKSNRIKNAIRKKILKLSQEHQKTFGDNEKKITKINKRRLLSTKELKKRKIVKKQNRK